MIDTKLLRKRIIDLAVSGKLNEGSGKNSSEELAKIISVLGNPPQRTIRDDEKWADIPCNWTWARLADLTTNDTLNDGNWVLSEDMVPDGDVKLIQLGSIGDCEYRFKGFKYLTEKHFKELNGRQIYPGYLLINRLVVDKMLSCIIPDDIKGILITAVDVCWVAPNDDLYSIEYLMYVMSSTGIQQRVQELGHGVTRFRISKLNLIDIAFPMPPLDEQRRIVNKINELYGILNKIDTLQECYCNNLESLKSKIIDAGIRGKLTEQLPTDGTAEELYAQILEEKAMLVKEKKIKKEKPLPAIEADEIPFEIPKSWKWVRLAEIYEINPKVDAENKLQAAFIPMEKISAGYSKEFSYEVQDWEHASKNHTKFQDGDIAFAKISPCFENRKSFIAKGLPNGIGGGTTELIILRQKRVHPEYSYYLVNDQRFIDAGSQSYKGIVGQQRVKADIIKHYLIPLPPLEEQKRIADKIDEVLQLIQ